MASAVPVRDVTPEEFSRANPAEKLVEARFEISSLVHSGSEQDLLQYFYRLESPQRSLRVVDYEPKTIVASDQAGNVRVDLQEEENRRLGLSYGAPLPVPVQVSGPAEFGTKQQVGMHYELTPQMTTVAASGTLERGSGLYFKLKLSRGQTLEGAKTFRIVFRVPRQWRGDYLHVFCTATGVRRGLVSSLNESAVCGSARFVLALYVEGDAAAQAAAERLSQAERRLWRAFSAQQAEIQRRNYPSLVQRVGVMLDVVRPPISENWPQEVIYGPGGPSRSTATGSLPPAVRQAAAEYAVARRQLAGLPAVQ
jgi:hypothetical protein